MPDPAVIEGLEAVQRDAVQTFLVDVDFAVYQPTNEDVTVTVEWKKGVTGAWAPATPQIYDRTHSAEGTISGVPDASPGKAIRFVWQAFFDVPEGTHLDIFVRVSVEVALSPTAVEEFGPFTVSTETETEENANLNRSLARKRVIDQTSLDYLGTGLIHPIRRGSRDFLSASGVDLIRGNVSLILGTRAAVGRFMGDHPWRPDFGCKLWILRHRNNNEDLRAEATAYVLEALTWEPRVNVTVVDVLRYPQAELNELKVRVRYQVITENVEDNRVVLPEYEEIVTIAA